MKTNLPITNNNLLPFIQAESQCINDNRRTENQGFNYDHCQPDSVSTESDSRLGSLLEAVTEGHMYLLIAGSIAFISGLLLSMISYYGLNTSEITPFLGKVCFLEKLLQVWKIINYI